MQPLFVQKLQVDLYSMVWKDCRYNVKVKNMLQKMDRKPAWKPESNKVTSQYFLNLCLFQTSPLTTALAFSSWLIAG